MKRSLLTLAATLLLTIGAHAHGPEKGAHGGARVDAGDYHVEMVANGATLTVYLSDGNDKPVEVKSIKATGIFVIGGKSQRIEFKPDEANVFTGTSAEPLSATPKGAVLLTLPDGKTAQAKFE